MNLRKQRLARQLQIILAEAIPRELADPRLGLVTVTKVVPSEDVTAARVYVSILGGAADWNKTYRTLKGAAGVLQAVIAREIKLRHTPILTFHQDTSAEKSVRVSSILRRIRETEEWQDPPLPETPPTRDE